MTKEEIREMAQKCGLIGMRPYLDGIYFEELESFAKLVAEKEREACAKRLETVGCQHCAKNIRQKGQE
jgi:hypothetical protein